MRKNLFKLVTAVLVVAIFTPQARGDLVLQFSDDNGSTFQTAFSGGVGESKEIDVYLSQTGAETILTDEGMFQFHTIGSLDTTLLGHFSSTTISDAWDNKTDDSTASLIDWHADQINGVFESNVHLGEFVFDLTASGTTTFSFGDNSSALDEWITLNFSVLDDDIFGASETDTFSMTITATAVPEPNTLGILGVGIFALVTGYRRRKRSSPTIVR